MAVLEDHPLNRPTFIPWPPILLLGALAGAWIAGIVVPFPWPGENDQPAHLIGLGFGVAGLALAVWAAMTLKRENTTILPHRGASRLVTTGPYAWRRNPIYLGDTLMLLGIAELTHNIWFAVSALLFVGLVTWLAILPEERHLAAKFGDDWHRYWERTRRLL